jgi:antitoxin component of MazEF toxin-antitoxin module
MKTRIIKIGKAKGIRIPSSLLRKSGLADEVQLEATSGRITIRSPKKARKGWAQDFKRMAANGDDKFWRDEPLLRSAWDDREWQW